MPEDTQFSSKCKSEYIQQQKNGKKTKKNDNKCIPSDILHPLLLPGSQRQMYSLTLRRPSLFCPCCSNVKYC